MIDGIMVFIAPISGAALPATIGHPNPMRRAVAGTEATPIDEDNLDRSAPNPAGTTVRVHTPNCASADVDAEGVSKSLQRFSIPPFLKARFTGRTGGVSQEYPDRDEHA